MGYVTAVVLAAGKGERLRVKTPKPLVEINSKPAIFYCLKTLSRHPEVKDIIVVVNAQNSGGIIGSIRKYGIRKIKGVVLGGVFRRDSVACGLKAVDARTDIILIHDAARPFIDKPCVSRAIRAAERYGAAVLGVPVKSTIKSVTASCLPFPRQRRVVKTFGRDNLWEIQTPQAFKKGLLLKAYQRYKNIPVTDDASLVERSGFAVRVVRGSYFNIKITTPEDLVIAGAILKAQSVKLHCKV